MISREPDDPRSIITRSVVTRVSTLSERRGHSSSASNQTTTKASLFPDYTVAHRVELTPDEAIVLSFIDSPRDAGEVKKNSDKHL